MLLQAPKLLAARDLEHLKRHPELYALLETNRQGFKPQANPTKNVA